MPPIHRLPPRLEHRILRAACGLSPGVQRLLFGRPPRLDGQQLVPDIWVLLRLAELVGNHSLTAGGGDPGQIRAEGRLEAAIAAGPPISTVRVEGLQLPAPAGKLRARLYLPGGVSAPKPPLLVYFHGGGWVIGDLDTHDGVCRFLATHGGTMVLSTEYRLAPENPFPAAIEDGYAAFQWAIANAAELGGDPLRVAVGGDSAGANMATVICHLARDGGGPHPAMQLLLYPPTDALSKHTSRKLFADGFLLTAADMEWFQRCYLPNRADDIDPRASVLRATDLSDLPPAYVVTAGFDPLRDEGEAYAVRMREAGVRVALRRHPDLIHGFANLTAVSRSARAAMLETAGGLRMGLS
jgi:acetyl esterase/lipase